MYETFHDVTVGDAAPAVVTVTPRLSEVVDGSVAKLYGQGAVVLLMGHRAGCAVVFDAIAVTVVVPDVPRTNVMELPALPAGQLVLYAN